MKSTDGAQRRDTEAAAAQRELVLHMGFYKTGSTSIQFACARNRARLRAMGIAYPLLKSAQFEDGENHSGLVYNLFTSSPDQYLHNLIAGHDVEAMRRVYRRRLDRALRSEARKLVISGEAISLLSADDHRELRRHVEAAGWTVRPIAYVRTAAPWFASLYSQRVRGGHVPPPGRASGIINRLEAVLEVFPSAEIYLFDHICREFGGPVEHFFGRLGVDDLSAFDIQPRNQSPSIHAIRVMARINSADPIVIDGKANPRRKYGDADLLLKIPGDKFFFNESELERFREEIDTLNAWIAAHLGPQLGDIERSPPPLECEWSDAQLDVVQSVLADLPAHFLEPVHDYFVSEAGLSPEQRERIRRWFARGPDAPGSKSSAPAFTARLLRSFVRASRASARRVLRRGRRLARLL